jgi:DNA replication and repair protein RecF
VHLKHLSLANFRNFVRLELDLPQAVTLIQGDNAQGKTNLLEAVMLLATSRSPRTGTDREWISWYVDREPLPFVRLEALLDRQDEALQLELLMAATGAQTANGPAFRKRIQVNGVPRRALDLVGLMKVVLFMPEDVALVAGSPSIRRRYLDIALCQLDNHYCRTLSRYQKVVERRNALLRQMRDAGGDPSQLDYWDRELVQLGSYLLAARWTIAERLDALGTEVHQQITGVSERLRLSYDSTVELAPDQREAVVVASSDVAQASESLQMASTRSQEIAAEVFTSRLAQLRPRERGAGLTLAGPHRDDMRFLLAGRDLRLYGSRGQQRIGALCAKLAEVEVMRERTGASPILLLDDVMSELDRVRRDYLLRLLDGSCQAIVTTTDWDDYAPAFRDRVNCLEARAGEIRPYEG